MSLNFAYDIVEIGHVFDMADIVTPVNIARLNVDRNETLVNVDWSDSEFLELHFMRAIFITLISEPIVGHERSGSSEYLLIKDKDYRWVPVKSKTVVASERHSFNEFLFGAHKLAGSSLYRKFLGRDGLHDAVSNDA
jgi:hypothetical protein